MPTLPQQSFDPLAFMGLSEKDAFLYEEQRLDGLAATRIVRRWGGPGHGLPEPAMAALAQRLDLSADADRAPGQSPALPGWQGEARYVANPLVEGVPHPGLWAGGPIQVQFERNVPRREDRTLFLEQVLTLVFHAGVWSVAQGGAVTLAGATASGALAALRGHRPQWRIGSDRRSPFRDDWPEEDTAEFAWRHWTHESEAALLALTDADLTAAIRRHSPDTREWRVAARRFEIDPDANAGVFTVTATCKDAGTVSASGPEASLAALPHKFSPVDRRRTRKFGLDNGRRGEGHYLTLSAEWPDLSRGSRDALLRIDNVKSVERIVKPEFPAATTIDGGRHWTGTGDARRAWWRLCDTAISEQDDGLLSLKLTWEMPEIDNLADSVKTEEYGGAGWGQRRGVTVPTVPSEKAPEAMDAIETPAGYVPARRAVRERDEGFSDASAEFHRVWGYTGTDVPPNIPTYQGIAAPDIEWRPNLCDGRGGVVLTFYRVARSAQDGVIAYATGAAVSSALAGARLRSIHIRGDEDGSEEIRVEYTTRLTAAEFSRLVSSDFFANVYRREYDGLDITPTGTVTDQDGNAVRIVDALGNEVPTVDVGGTTTLFRPGIRIAAAYERDADCKWRVAVTTEVAVARSWEYDWQTNRNGHPQTVRVRVWRNFADRPVPAPPAHGDSADCRDELNAFGLHDGQAAVSPDLHEERREAVSDNAHESSARTDAFHTSGQTAAVSAAKGQAKTKTVTTYSDGLQDVSETTETGKPSTTAMAWRERRAGHDIDVRQEEHRNAAAMPAVSPGANGRASASASVNRFGLVDATVRTETDVWVRREREEREDAFQRTVRETVHADGDGAANASGGDGGPLVSGSDAAYSDSRHDTAKTTVTPKPKAWSWTWEHVYWKGERATAYGHAWRNQPAGYWLGLPRPADGDGYVYEGSPNVRMNEFGLYDGELAFVPRHDGGGRAADRRMFYATTDVHAEYVERRSYRHGEQTVRERRTVSRWTTKSYSTSHAGAENAAGAGHAPAHAGHEVVHADVSDPFQSLLGKTMWRTVRVMEKAEPWEEESVS